MKRFLALFLAAVMTVGLVACGSTEEPAASSAATENTEEAVTEEPAEEASQEEEKPSTVTIQSLNANKELADL